MDERMRELGAFLRARREKTSPSDVGLPPGGRRRTPGLRREEVAALAGVGVTWYTWLEQGRAPGVSDQVIEAVARVLRMTDAERHHALVLAGRAPVTVGPPMMLRPEQAELLESLLPFPAAIQADGYEIVAANRSYRFLFHDLDDYAPEDRNCAWLMFTDPVWNAAIIDRDVVLPEIAARLRARRVEHPGDPRWDLLIARLRDASPHFRELWERYEVADDRPSIRRYRSPAAGDLTVHFQSLWLDPARGTRVIVMSPADARTRERLERLAALTASAPSWTAREDVLAA